MLPARDTSHDLQVRYFTPSAEVAICGHAPIAPYFLRALKSDNLAGKHIYSE